MAPPARQTKSAEWALITSAVGEVGMVVGTPPKERLTPRPNRGRDKDLAGKELAGGPEQGRPRDDRTTRTRGDFQIDGEFPGRVLNREPHRAAGREHGERGGHRSREDAGRGN